MAVSYTLIGDPAHDVPTQTATDDRVDVTRCARQATRHHNTMDFSDKKIEIADSFETTARKREVQSLINIVAPDPK
jgi:hypothetical protein